MENGQCVGGIDPRRDVSELPARKRVCWVTTTAFIANSFLRPHLKALAHRYDTTLLLNVNDGYAVDPGIAGVRIQGIRIRRKISLLEDALALCEIAWRLMRGRFDAVHTFAPKAGLLGMLGALLARVPVRIHTFQGELWATRRGPMRTFLKSADWLIARLATHVLVVGRGEREFLELEGVLPAGRGKVLGEGSIAGVDANRFRPDPASRLIGRRKLGVQEQEVLMLFLGRLVKDKGVLDLVHAFVDVAGDHPELVLGFVGPDEDAVAAELRAAAGRFAGRLRFAGYTDQPERYLCASDLVCLPSYREGFSTVILEAGACSVPALASRIYGTADAVVEGVTGLFHAPGDMRQIADGMIRIAADPALRESMGLAARQYVFEHYRAERVVAAMEDFYMRVVAD